MCIPLVLAGAWAVQYVKRMPLRTTVQRGFTLIELLLVIALMTALGGMFALNVGAARDQARLEASARELQSLLREAQTLGRTGRGVSSGCAGVDKYDCGYGVYIDGDTGSILLYSGTGASSTVIAHNTYIDTPPGQKVREFTLQTGVTIKNAKVTLDADQKNKAHIHFRRGLLGAVISDGTDVKTTASTTLSTESGLTRSVVVNSVGLIYVE